MLNATPKIKDGRNSTSLRGRPGGLYRKRRGRSLKNYKKPKLAVSEHVRAFDPLSKRKEYRSDRVVMGMGYLFLALLAHGTVLGAFIGSSSDNRRIAVKDKVETVVVRMSEPKPNPAKPEPVSEPPVEVKTDPVPVPQPIKKTPQRSNVPKRVAQKTPEPAAADPVNMSEAPPASSTPTRRIVGISFESTVTGGKGPSFAVGNTRMGMTENKAAGASGIQALPKGRTSGKVQGPNRVAGNIPSTGVEIVKPRRLSALQPQYPNVLKAQGVEGNVVVLVSINEKGRVTQVRVVKGSGYDELDKSAKSAATKERFSPAKRNGEPIAYTLKYTYRFRVRES